MSIIQQSTLLNSTVYIDDSVKVVVQLRDAILHITDTPHHFTEACWFRIQRNTDDPNQWIGTCTTEMFGRIRDPTDNYVPPFQLGQEVTIHRSNIIQIHTPNDREQYTNYLAYCLARMSPELRDAFYQLDHNEQYRLINRILLQSGDTHR